MEIHKYRVALALTVWLVFLHYSPQAADDISGPDKSLVEQIYQLTVRSKTYVDADLIDSALISAYAADSLAKSRNDLGDTTSAAAYNNLAYCHFRNEAGEIALAYLDSALTALKHGKHGEDSLFADIYVNYGRIYDQTSEYGQAIESYEKALSIQETVLGPDHSEVGTTSNNLAIVKMYIGQYDEAEQLFFKTLKIWKRVFGPEHSDVGLCLFNLGYLYDDLGRYEEAEKCYLESLAIREKALGSDHSSIGIIRVNIAALQVALGKDDLALGNLYKARDIIGKSLGDRSIYYSRALISIASLLIHSQGNYAEGESLYKEALSICAETFGPESDFAASLYTQLARYSGLLGNTEASLEYSRKASEITLNIYGKNSIDFALSIARIAFACSRLIGYSDAPLLRIDSLYEEYESIISECGTSKVNDYSNSLRLLGAALYNFGMYQESERLLKLYLSSGEWLADRVPAHGEIALLSFMMGNEREALESAADFAALVADAGDLPLHTLSHCHSTLVEIHLFAGHFEEALAHLKEAHRYQDLFLRTAFSNASQATKIALLNNSTYTSFLPTKLDEINTREALALALEHEMIRKSYVIEAISHEHEFVQCSDDPHLRIICDEYSSLSSRTASLVRASIGNYEQGASQDLINALIKERDSLETVISNICGNHDMGSSVDEFGVENIVRRLKAGDILIEYIRFLSTDSLLPESILRKNKRFNYGAFILDSSGKLDFYDLGPVMIIDSLIAQCREHISNTGTKALTTLGPAIEQHLSEINKALYLKILAPFAHHLDNKKHLIIAPERNIYLVPFEILPIDHNRYLLEEYQVSYLASGMDLLKDNDSDCSGPIVVFADPDYECDLQADIEASDDTTLQPSPSERRDAQGTFRGSGNCALSGFERLPHTAEEMQGIEDLVTKYSTKQLLIYTGDLAREKTLTSLSPEPSALHLATHGFICVPDHPDFEARHVSPMFQSGLALAGANRKPNPNRIQSAASFEDGILSAYEVSALNLIGTDLVVLSACETGIGEYVNGMGLMGLRSSFRQAGAKSVIMSLWKVPDDLSARIMKGFYRRWLSGESKIDALRETSLELLNEARTKYGNGHPIHWSGFILAGKSQ